MLLTKHHCFLFSANDPGFVCVQLLSKSAEVKDFGLFKCFIIALRVRDEACAVVAADEYLFRSVPLTGKPFAKEENRQDYLVKEVCFRYCTGNNIFLDILHHLHPSHQINKPS